MLTPTEIIFIAGIASLTLLCARIMTFEQRAGDVADTEGSDDAMALLFDSGLLIHGSDTALRWIGLTPGVHDWEDLRDTLLPFYPECPHWPAEQPEHAIQMPPAPGTAAGELLLRWRGGTCWVVLGAQCDLDGPIGREKAELAALRRTTRTAPGPIWHVGQDGQLCWHNHVYAQLRDRARSHRTDPDAALFETVKVADTTRLCLREDDPPHTDWYELHSVVVDGVTVNHAIGINAVVEAEQSQIRFVQTLAKTFSHLSTGLAIFDNRGQLLLFNPALVDLTSLPPQFLTARPTMLSFFDSLREARRMPEPRNYMTWRQEIAGVIAAATDGTFSETWSLECGRTYKVAARAHPDGATAFLIEDISDSVSVTRNFRSELELSQTVMDTFDDALAIFSPTGVLTFANAAYIKLWRHDPGSTFADVTVNDAIDVWKQRTTGTANWAAISALTRRQDTRPKVTVTTTYENGATLTCTAKPIAAGATLVRFNCSPAAAEKRPDHTHHGIDPGS